MAKILVIDDMHGVRHSVAAVLQLDGHEVTEAADGGEGIEILSDNEFDLLITDILMPEKDGSEVIMFVREREGKKIPILAISGGGTMISADKALSVAKTHADSVLKKPFSREDLLEQVNNLIS